MIEAFITGSCEFSMAMSDQMAGGEPLPFNGVFFVKRSVPGAPDSIDMFRAQKKDAAFFRQLADQLDKLTA